MLMRRHLTALICAALLAGALASCGSAPQAPGGEVATTASNPTVVSGAATDAAAVATALAPTAAAVAPTLAAAPTAVGAANLAVPPETIAAMVADLVAQQGVAPEAVSVVSAEAVSWPDGSLGCPRPGMMYPQVITEGFRVILAAGGAEYAYHGDDRGEFFYCENPAR